VQLTCPAGQAVNGGFVTDSALVFDNGSWPASDVTWTVEATNIGDFVANSQPFVRCKT
jgi:hypothetical protein